MSRVLKYHVQKLIMMIKKPCKTYQFYTDVSLKGLFKYIFGYMNY